MAEHNSEGQGAKAAGEAAAAQGDEGEAAAAAPQTDEGANGEASGAASGDGEEESAEPGEPTAPAFVRAVAELAAAVASAEAAKAGPRIRLAHHPRLKRARTITGGGGVEPTLFEPVTAEGFANVYGFPPVFFPAAEEQKSGFTPLFVARIDGRPSLPEYAGEKARGADPYDEDAAPLKLADAKTAGGQTLALDADSGEEAARLVLLQWPGRYKPVEGKGD